jgi:hypothetical protein
VAVAAGLAVVVEAVDMAVAAEVTAVVGVAGAVAVVVVEIGVATAEEIAATEATAGKLKVCRFRCTESISNNPSGSIAPNLLPCIKILHLAGNLSKTLGPPNSFRLLDRPRVPADRKQNR